MPTIRLSDAQQSAFECRDWSEEPAVRAALTAGQCSALVFWRSYAERLSEEITDASNAEDAFAEMHAGTKCATYARRAAYSLAIVAGKVLKASQSQSGTK